MLAPEYLEQCVAALDAHPDAVLRQTLVEQIGASGEFLSIFDTSATGADSPAFERFGASILTFHHAIDIFGVIRAEALARTPLHLPHAGSDKAPRRPRPREPFTYVREPLFIHRDHPGRFVHQALKSRDETLYGTVPTAPRNRSGPGGGTIAPCSASSRGGSRIEGSACGATAISCAG